MEEKEDKFGDFEEVVEEEKAKTAQKPGAHVPEGGEQIVVRARMPRGKEVIGVIAQRLGGNKMEVKCTDGKTRNCRVPGRFKRSMWLRPGDFVLVEPWENDADKADVVFQYRGGQINQLRKRGLLDSLNEGF